MTMTASPDNTTVMATVRNWSELRQNRARRLRYSRQFRPPRLAWRLSGGTCTIADAPNGHHDARVVRILLDLGTQPLHVHVHQPRVCLVVVAPHLLEEHLAGEHLLRLEGESEQQFELERGEVDLRGAALDLVARDVEHEIAHVQL